MGYTVAVALVETFFMSDLNNGAKVEDNCLLPVLNNKKLTFYMESRDRNYVSQR